MKISWEASDLNQITKYELYVSKNPTDQANWTVINNNITAQTTSYLIDTSNLQPGTYKAILRATDNQNPALVGMGLSPEITISGTTPAPVEEDDDVVVIADPQVINMSPNSTDNVVNKQVTTKATIIAGTNATINDDSIVVKLDDKDISKDISINKISAQEHTIIYQPSENLDGGLHKMEIYFKDSNGKSVTKSWTFTIQEEETVAEGYVSLFGTEISQRTLIIVGVGILVIILAIVVPIIIFRVWKDEQNKNEDESSENGMFPNLPAEPVPAFTPTPSEISELVKEPSDEITEEQPTEDVWNNYAAPIPQETPITIQRPIPIEEPMIEEASGIEEISEVTPGVEPEPIIEKTPIAQPIEETPAPVYVAPEVIEPEPVIEETPIIQSIEETPAPAYVAPIAIPATELVTPEAPVENATPTPPEPDLTTDLNPEEDLVSIYEQIQQAEQAEPEETPTPKE